MLFAFEFQHSLNSTFRAYDSATLQLKIQSIFDYVWWKQIWKD